MIYGPSKQMHFYILNEKRHVYAARAKAWLNGQTQCFAIAFFKTDKFNWNYPKNY